MRSRQTALTREQLIEIGRGIGLDPQRLEQAITEDRYRELIIANERRLERLRSPTAPNVFFNDVQPRTSISAVTEVELERAYQDAYERALELMDRGVDPAQLPAAFDAQLPPVRQAPIPIAFDDEAPDNPRPDHPLANPPLELAGLPSHGKPGVTSPVTIVVVCRPNDSQCSQLLRSATSVQKTFDGEVRLVWAPWFDVAREEAADMSLLGDAALCAERVGSSPDDFDASPGWRWVNETYSQLQRSMVRRKTAGELIDYIAGTLGVDSAQLSACRARMANTTLNWVGRARRSGITRSPSLVIGGRIYPGFQETVLIQQIVDQELAPGVLGEAAPAWRAPSSTTSP